MDTKPRVSIIDDDESIRKGLTTLLRSAGYETLAYASGAGFLSAVEDQPGCIVLDMQMPETSGLELQAALIAQGIHLPIIFLSGHGDVPTTAQAMKQGAVDFLEKPVDEAALLAVVDKALQINHERRCEMESFAAIQARLDSLTAREHEVLRHVITGRLNKQIADQLAISEKTVKVHRAHVMTKMDVRSVAELVRLTETIGVRPFSPSTAKVQ